MHIPSGWLYKSGLERIPALIGAGAFGSPGEQIASLAAKCSASGQALQIKQRQTSMDWSTSRFVVSKFANGGIGDHLSCLIGSWHYAQRTGRTLIVDWRGSRFNAHADQQRNCFEQWFEPLGTVGGVTTITDDAVCSADWGGESWPEKWTPSLLAGTNHVQHTEEELAHTRRLIETGADMPQRIVAFNGPLAPWPPRDETRKVVARLVFRPETRAKVDRFLAEKLDGRAPIAIHLRHGNGENIGARAAYWVRPGSLVRQLLRNRKVSMHAGGTWGRFGDNMPDSVVGSPEERGAERAFFKRIARSIEALRAQPDMAGARPLLFTDAPHIFDELVKFVPDLVSASDRKEANSAGPLHQVKSELDAATRSVRIGTMPREVTAEMMCELALMRSAAALICIDSGFTAITRAELEPARTVSLRPTFINSLILKVNARL